MVETLGYFPSLRDKGDYAWRLLKEEKLGERMLDRPKLSSLATAILELSTSMDPRGDYALLAKVRTVPPCADDVSLILVGRQSIAHAQLLGCVRFWPFSPALLILLLQPAHRLPVLGDPGVGKVAARAAVVVLAHP